MTNMMGQTIGQYQILEFIAKGVTSLVYKGFQPSMNRYVAVKILASSAACRPEQVAAFHEHAQIMAQFDHLHILRIYDDGQEGEVAYVVSRFAEGGTLHKQLGDYRTPLAAAQLLQPVTEALAYIHEQGHTHGNVKPENILLEDGSPLLIDFGSHVVPGLQDVYQSPEQAQGGLFDPRTDVYAQGVLLFEMMVGALPEWGTVPSPRHYRPDLPEAVEKVILKAMDQEQIWDPQQKAAVSIVSLAAPTVGNMDFVKYAEFRMGNQIKRIWHPLDVVTYAWDKKLIEKMKTLYLPEIKPDNLGKTLIKTAKFISRKTDYKHICAEARPLPGAKVVHPLVHHASKKPEHESPYFDQVQFQHVLAYFQLLGTTGFLAHLSKD